MFFNKKKKIEKHARNFDKLVTGLIIGGAVASMIGFSKTNKGKEITKNIKKEGSSIFKKGYNVFGKALVGVIKIFNKK